MKKLSLLWILLLVPLVTALNYVDDKVYIDDSKAFIEATNILSNDGYVSLNYMTKTYTGNIDIAFCTQGEPLDPLVIERKNVYDDGNSTVEEWQTVKSLYSLVGVDYADKDTCFVFEDVPTVANTLYENRVYMTVKDNAKYDIALKPSTQSINVAISSGNFYLLDPVVNETVGEFAEYFNRSNGALGTVDFGGITWGTDCGSSICDVFNNQGRFNDINTADLTAWLNIVDQNTDAWNMSGSMNGGGRVNAGIHTVSSNPDHNNELIRITEDATGNMFSECTGGSTTHNTDTGINAGTWFDFQFIINFTNNNISSYINGAYLDSCLMSGDVARSYGVDSGNTPTGTMLLDNLTWVNMSFARIETIDVVFLNQTPENLTTRNLINDSLNIIYNISNGILDNSTPVLKYNVTDAGVQVNSFLNGSSIELKGTILRDSFVNSLYTFILGEDEVYQKVENIAEEVIGGEDKINLTVGANTNVFRKIRFFNVSSVETDNFLEIMLGETVNNQQLWYCNSSYSTGNILSSPNCALFETFSSTGYNHSEGSSFYHSIPIPIINQKINGVKVTQESFILLRGGTGNTFSYVVNETRPDTIQTTNNGGIVFSNFAGTIDAHIHQNNPLHNLTYFACANDTTDNEFCSSVRVQSFETPKSPPSAPVINSPSVNTSFQDETVLVNYTASQSAENTIVFYSIDLLNEDFSFNQVLESNNGLNTSFIFNSSSITSNGNYRVQVMVHDNESLTNSDISEIFLINNTVPPVPPKTVAESIEDLMTLIAFMGFFLIAIICFFISNFDFGNSNSEYALGSTVLKAMALVSSGISYSFAEGLGQQVGLIFFIVVIILNIIISWLLLLVKRK